MRALFVAPRLSAALFLVWLFLNGSLTATQLALGAIVAITVPLVIERRSHVRPFEGRRVALSLRLMARVAVDIVRSNLELAARIIGPESALRPRYLWVPVALESPAGIAILCSIVTLTPGTVSVDVSPDRRRLLVHAFDVESERDLAESIKTRYEQVLMEIFE